MAHSTPTDRLQEGQEVPENHFLAACCLRKAFLTHIMNA